MQENRREKSKIKQNILLYLSIKGVSEYEYYKVSGTTRGILGQNNGISEDNLTRFLAYAPDVNPDWLLTGQGPMLKSDQTEAPTSPDTINPPTYDTLTPAKVSVPLQNISEIPLYNIDASAGLSKLLANGGELLGKIRIPNAPKCDGAVYVIGDSMYPLLKSGDIIAYREIHNPQSIIYGEIYLIQIFNDGDLSIVVKYVKRSERGDDYIKLVSYNKEHDPKDIPLSWVQSIARVTFTIRKFSIT